MTQISYENEICLRLLKRISESDGILTQRDLAGYLDLSLGKTHYCLTELIKKGLIKATRFKNSQNKAAYVYILTPRGIEEKFRLLVQFLHSKKKEYEMLGEEISSLSKEIEKESDTLSSDLYTAINK